MSYNKSCNVDVLKTFDLRVRPINNISPGLYSTLTAGPQQVYGSPLTWEYILLLSDVQNIKVQHSTIISNEYIVLSTNIRYISTYLDNTISTLSSFLYANFINLETANVFLQGTFLHNVSNFYQETNAIPYPSTFSTVISNFSTLSTVIQALIPTLTYISTTSTLHEYQISTIQTLNIPIQPLISTLSSFNINYSSILYRNLKQSESNLQSTVVTSVSNFLSNQSTTFSIFQSTLSNTSSYIYSAFSSQYFIYSTINGVFLNDTNTVIKADFSSFSTIIGYQFSSVDVLYSGSILESISSAKTTGINTINSSFQTIASSISKTYSTLQETLSTQNSLLDYNNSLLSILQYQYITYQILSTQVVQLSFYSTISRPQTFYELDFYLNNIHISTYYLPSSISAPDLQINQSIAAAYLESQYTYNSTILSSLFASNTSNAYYNIIKAYRANNIPLIDTISNSISNFINPSSISTAYGQYSTQVRSSITQTYKIVVQSERLAIRNTSNVFITANQSSSSRSSIVGSAFLSLSNEMKLITSTSFNNLISYTFASFRSNSELTLRELNQAETSNNSVLYNYTTDITDHTIQDSFYYNLSTLFSSNFVTTKNLLESTTISLLNSDSTFIRYFSTISSLSTFFYSNISSFISTVNYSTYTYSISSLTAAETFNLSTLSTFNSFKEPMSSSISTFLTQFVFSTLSTYIYNNYSSLSNLVVDISGNLFSTLNGISNRVDIFNASQGYIVYSSIIICNTTASNVLYNIYCNSINLSVNQFVLSTFTTLSSIFVNGPMSMFEGGVSYDNYLASISTMGTYVSLFNFSSFSTATSVNFTTLANYSTFSYSSFSSFVVSPFLIYNLSSFSTATSISFNSISTIQFSPSNLLNYSTFNMSTMSTINYVYSTIFLTDSQNYNINTSTIISSLYRQIFGGMQYKDVPPTFAPYVYDAFFPIAAKSTITSFEENGGLRINYNTQGDFFTNFFERSTLVKSSRKMYNIFVSSAGANGASLINSLPITISSLTREPALQSTATTFNTNTLVTYISNYFQSQDFTEQGFTINDILIDFKTIADFPTVKLYIQKISTITYFDIIKPDPQEFRNTVYYGAAGDFLRGGDATFISPNSTRGIGGGGGGAGFKGGQAGGFTTAVAGATSQIQNKYFIGGGGGGGGSSYIAPLTGTGNSLPGQTFNSGYTTHPLASALKSGQGGIDSNSFNNYLYPSTFSSITTPFSSKKGGDGLLILTEFVDPFRIVVSNGTQYFVPLRIDAATNEVVVNKLVISSAQVVSMSATHPSSFYLDFANYQQFYLTLKDHEVSSFHIIPLTTISSSSMNFQTGNIYLNISTVSTNAVIDFSSFNIENTWNQDTPGVLSSYGNRSTYLFEYSIFNSNIYLTTPRTW